MSDWVQVKFRGELVFAQVGSQGNLLVEEGFVPFCYTPGGKVYRTRSDRLEPAEGKAEGKAAASPKRVSRTAKPSRARSGKPGFSLADLRPENEAVQVWTDGACTGNPGPAGIGVLILHEGRIVELSESLGMATNNIAELTAILRGLEKLEDPNVSVDVVTDSSYCIGLLTQGWKAKANQELVATVRKAMERFTDLRFVKVKGHAGVDGNERADELARQGVSALGPT